MLNPAGAKRKRHNNERGDSEKLPKRWRYNLEEMAQKEAITLVRGSPSESASRSSVVLPARGQPGKCRLSRTHRLRQQSLCLGPSDEPKPAQSHQPDSDGATLICHRRDKRIEDLLWTDKYCPQNSSEVIGNSTSVKKLHSWLKRWKLRADCEERRRELEKRQEDDSNDSWDCGDFQGEACVEEEGEELSTTMLITGPPGVGKTASVYACALELGFKVFEVNASCQRNGRHVLTQLKEATQSHLVDIQGHALLKPTYLRNSSSTKPDTLSGTETSSRKLVSSSRKFPRQNSCSTRHKGKGNQAAITLANFFKMKSKAESIAVDGLSSKNTDIQISSNHPSPDNEEPATGKQNKMTTTSLILFEEVDVIFDDDVGFLSAIKTFMSTTKRPVILTTDDPSFRTIFNANFEAVLFKTPSTVNTCSYLRLLCLAENIRTEHGDITSLLEVTGGDIRRGMLQVQLWGSSREKRSPQTEAPETSKVPITVDPKSKDRRPLCHLPQCELGCTPSMLGLLNAGLRQELVNFQKSWMDPEVIKLMEVLRESWRRGVPLLYSNLELLSLSTARTQPVSLSIPEEVSQTEPRNHPRPADIHPQTPELSCTAPTRTSSRLSRKKRTRVSDPGSIHSVSPHRTSLSLNIHSRTSSTNDKPTTLNQARRLESQSLGALADFMDLMSHLDSTLPTPVLHPAGPCGSGEFIWTGARVKDGLLDEMRVEEHGSCSAERVLEIQAALEALAFHTCHTVVSGVWGRGQDLGEGCRDGVTEELTSPVAPHRQIFSFTHTSILEPSVSQRRYDINKIVFSSRAFSTMGNKQAIAVDYLPILRTVCQSQRSQEQAGGRFQHYFSRIQLGLSKSTIQLLAEDFP
ncbi:ATPase family AAA domain-containing protein 5b [Osmerus mordax]|uniref:ATPase family AAA domain-containing protein 5b n=1 Tax=Osmerus mordax TaxID=8014 RepID=UPI00350F1437